MKGIIFDGPSVRAIRRDDKTQTRRVIKTQPPDWRPLPTDWGNTSFLDEKGCVAAFWDGVEISVFSVPGQGFSAGVDQKIKPRYRPGEIVYVKETWAINLVPYHTGPIPKAWPEDEHGKAELLYRADGEFSQQFPEEFVSDTGWRSPLYMPEWAARIHLEIVAVRAERLQKITPMDVEREGIVIDHYYCDEGGPPDFIPTHRCDPVGQFAEHWDAINARRGYPWANNDFVFAYTFRKVTP